MDKKAVLERPSRAVDVAKVVNRGAPRIDARGQDVLDGLVQALPLFIVIVS